MATFCTRCGRQINPGAICECSMRTGPAASPKTNVDTTSLKAFYVSMKNRMGIGEPEKNMTDCYERGLHIVPQNIRANEGEIPVKQYDVAILRTRRKFERAEGRLQVTNKRVLFRAAGRSVMGRTTLQHEFAIQEIAGFEIRKNYRFSLFDLLLGWILASICALLTMLFTVWVLNKVLALGVIVGLLFGILGQMPFFTVRKMFFGKMLACGISVINLYVVMMLTREAARIKDSGFLGFLGIVLLIIGGLAAIVFLIATLLFCFKPNLAFDIKTKSGTPPIPIRSKSKGIIGFFSSSAGGEFTGFSEVLPWVDAESAIREVGAMITDIQTLGNFGVEKWMRK